MLVTFLVISIIATGGFIFWKKYILPYQKRHRHEKIVAYILLSQEEERKRIASSIHDNFCSRLSIIKLLLHTSSPDKLPEEVFIQIDKAYQAARLLSHQIDSPVLERMGLLEAIRDYIRPLYGFFKIEVRVLQILSQQLARQVELHLFRIVQEAITNIIRHANANTVHIDIHVSGRQAALRITDNGVGFDPKIHSPGAGFKNIEMRVAFMKGRYRIRSHPHEGTSLVVAVPIVPSALEDFLLWEALYSKTRNAIQPYTNPSITTTHAPKSIFGYRRR